MRWLCSARVFRHAIRYFIRVTPLFSFLVRAQFAYFMPTAVDTYALLKRKTHYVLKQYHAARTIFSTYYVGSYFDPRSFFKLIMRKFNP